MGVANTNVAYRTGHLVTHIKDSYPATLHLTVSLWPPEISNFLYAGLAERRLDWQTLLGKHNTLHLVRSS